MTESRITKWKSILDVPNYIMEDIVLEYADRVDVQRFNRGMVRKELSKKLGININSSFYCVDKDILEALCDRKEVTVMSGSQFNLYCSCTKDDYMTHGKGKPEHVNRKLVIGQMSDGIATDVKSITDALFSEVSDRNKLLCRRVIALLVSENVVSSVLDDGKLSYFLSQDNCQIKNQSGELLDNVSRKVSVWKGDKLVISEIVGGLIDAKDRVKSVKEATHGIYHTFDKLMSKNKRIEV